MTQTDTLLTISEVAEALRVHPRTLWLLRKEGRFFDPIRVGSAIRFRQADLAAWVASQ